MLSARGERPCLMLAGQVRRQMLLVLRRVTPARRERPDRPPGRASARRDVTACRLEPARCHIVSTGNGADAGRAGNTGLLGREVRGTRVRRMHDAARQRQRAAIRGVSPGSRGAETAWIARRRDRLDRPAQRPPGSPGAEIAWIARRGAETARIVRISGSPGSFGMKGFGLASGMRLCLYSSTST